MIGIALHDAAKAYFKTLLAMLPPTDAWIASHRNQTLETYGEFLGLVQASGFPPFDGYIADVLSLAEDSVGNGPLRLSTRSNDAGSGSSPLSPVPEPAVP